MLFTTRVLRAIIVFTRGDWRVTFKELEKIITHDGWKLKKVVGSHYQYIHNNKKGKVTIPKHSGDIKMPIVKSVLKQAGIK